MAKIATWNVNSIKARLPNVLAWLDEFAPDVALLQEVKCQEDGFPALEVGDLGYNAAVAGQKSYNGVAVLSKTPIELEHRALPGGDGDEQARYIEALTETDAGVVRVASIYLPNGNPVGGDKFAYKLAWLDRLRAHAAALLRLEEITVLGGDYNVIPTDDDVWDPEAMADDALIQPESRAGLRSILHLGYTDALRAWHREPGLYSYWDYQRGAWQKDHGMLIDHILLSPQAADRLVESGIDRKPRGKERASDHTPVWCALST